MIRALSSGLFAAAILWLPLQAWSAESSISSVKSQFNSQKTFDFSTTKQLIELPTYGIDPSYISNGKLITPIAAGEHKGLGKKYYFEKDDQYTNEAEVSFDISLERNFQTNTHPAEVGKFTGMEGIYDNSAGWGGNMVTTQDSWSIRIGHKQQNSQGQVPIGLYIYHPGMTDKYGTTINANYALQPMQTYRLTLYVKLNDVGSSNGVIKLAVNGKEVYSASNWKLRLRDRVHIKSIWLDNYIGGKTPTPVSTSATMDNLQILWNQCTKAGCPEAVSDTTPLPPDDVKVILE